MENEVQTAERRDHAENAMRPIIGFTELMQAARAFAKSSIVPEAFRNKPDDAFVALEWGMELGMKPTASLQNIYVVKGRPTLSAQSMAGLIKSRSDYRGLIFESSPTKAKVTIKRAIIDGSIEVHTGEFTIEQAAKAGLTGKDNWKNYAQQMLEARALAFAVRKAFPDVFAGIYLKEEAQDFDNIRDVTPPAQDERPAKQEPLASHAETPEPQAVTVETIPVDDDIPADDPVLDAVFGPPSESVLAGLAKDKTPRGFVKYARVKYDADLSAQAKTVIDRLLASPLTTDDVFNRAYNKAQEALAAKGIAI